MLGLFAIPRGAVADLSRHGTLPQPQLCKRRCLPASVKLLWITVRPSNAVWLLRHSAAPEGGMCGTIRLMDQRPAAASVKSSARAAVDELAAALRGGNRRALAR